MSPVVVSNISPSSFRQLRLLLRKIFTGFSWPIFLTVLLLSCIGILAIFLADRPDDSSAASQPIYRLLLSHNYLRQSAFLAAGMVLFLAVVFLDYRILGRHAYVLFTVSIFLLVLVLVLPSAGETDVHRWFVLGPLRLQPSELAKIAFVIALAWYLRFRKSYRNFVGFLWPFSFSLVPMSLIVIEPDLGTGLLFLPTLIAVLFAAGARKRHIALVFLLGLLAMPLFWTKINADQKTRILGWLQQTDPSASSGPGYQLSRSLVAIGSGGPFGQPWGQATMIQTDQLVYDHTDFVFAVVGAQAGLLGTATVLVLYLILFGYGLRIAQTNPDPFGRLLAVGIVAMLATQTIVNISVTIGLLPITGMTLPFVSYGGSSLWSSLAAVAMLISVGKYRPISLGQRAFEFDSD